MKPEPRFPQVIVDVPLAEAEEASLALFDLGASGVEQRDESTLVRGTPGKVTLLASFADEQEALAACGELPPRWSPRESAVIGDAWRDDWKKYFRPFEVCPGVIVRPPWERYEPKGGERVLELEPGRAFGTGLHETTSLVAHALHDRVSHFEGKTVLDVGCGSGILSLVALTLGAASARCVDVDPEAIAVTRENAARNGLTARLSADTRAVGELDETYPFVVANIEASVLIPMAEALARRLAPAGLLVLSGLLALEAVPDQLPAVRRAYVEAGLVPTGEQRKGEWVALVMQAGQRRP